MAESNINPEQHQPGNGLPGGPLPPGVNPQHPGMQQSHQRHSAPFFNGPPSAQQSSSTSSSSAEASHQLFQQLMQQQQVFMQQQQQHIQVPPNPEMILDSLANNIKEFRYDPDGNITFAAWYGRYDDLFEQDAARLDDEAKVLLLMRKLGSSEHERYVSYILPKLPKDYKFTDTVEKLKILFGAAESVISKRYRCLQVTKQPTDDYVTYACRINKTCVEFELSKLTEEQFKCLMFVCGLKSEGDSEIRPRLLSKIEERDNITLDHLSEDCQRLLCLKRDTAMIESSASPSSVNFIKRKQFSKHQQKPPMETAGPDKNIPSTPCWFCGGMHFVRDCTHRSHKCKDCGIVGHREVYCSTAKRTSKASRNKKHPGSYATKSVSLVINTVDKRRRFVTVMLNGVNVRLQLDTGSDISIISKRLWEKIGKPPTVPANEQAATASGDRLQFLFNFSCDISFNDKQHTCQFYVVEKPLYLLGIDLMDAFDLWSLPISTYCNNVTVPSVTLQSLKSAYPRVFRNELGLCTKTKVKLELIPGATPVFRAKRPVAYAVHSSVDNELDRLERAKIITPVDFSDWAAPIVVVRKTNGSIRICGDYSTGLNNALQPHQYPLPLPEEIFNKLANCTVEVDESSRELLTINTHRGLYRYNRLTPGVKAAPGAFQQLIDTMLAGLPHTCGYLDDVVVGGVICLTATDFARIHQRFKPSTKGGLGAINYYGKFVPSMRTLRYPLDELLKADAKFEWTEKCQAAFNKFKEVLKSDLLLTHYNPSLDIVVSADASSVGVGATLSHKFPDGTLKVVQHASRALTAAEKNYSQPDREGLAIIFAVTKFHKMLFGRRFHLQTDHEPLLRIFGSKKGIPVYTSNRLQRWALTLLLYEFTIEYVPTAKFDNADILSRLINQHVRPEEDYVIASVSLENDLRIVQQSTQSDPITKAVYRYLIDGWPKTVTDAELKRFYARRESLTTVQGCILFGDRLVIPSPHRKRSLQQLHRGHPGIQRMKAIARSYVYWPTLDNDIVDYVKSCHQCAMAAKTPPKSAPLSWPKSTKPWQRVHLDYAGPIDGEYYLVVVDSFSKWPEIVQTRSITTAATIKIIRELFARLGMPETLVSDNGSQFTSAEFQSYCTDNGIEHLTTAPFHPQSNGQAERFVDTFKRSIKKIKEGRATMREALSTFLLTYRSTPCFSSPDGKSPAEVMFGRPIRTSLDLLRPPPDSVQFEQPSESRPLKRECKAKDPVYAKVFVKNQWHWAPGTVLECIGRVMYNVQLDNRRLVRSHVNQLRDRAISEDLNVSTSTDSTKLPLNILLDAWNLPVRRTTDPLAHSTPVAPLTSCSSLRPSSTPNTLVRRPTLSSESSSQLSVSSSSSSTSPSSTSEFQSANEADSAVQVPRRSSRVRRAPQWFDPYQLY
ncbi:uncharacterized protein K02A2.6-like [Topomyia yanbarensis]|uniref:uncharacterized protein K02A2.6-like n=1 Tax=Topomyia yanbarensis TaxID=2498891 RepID=UPI00273AB1D9|nr:uncharacterized protein K02A2.6-like [Topomyia yanbarensis]